MFGQLSRVIYPSKGSGSAPPPPPPCPTIYNFDIEEICTNACADINEIFPAGNYTFKWECVRCALITEVTITDPQTLTELYKGPPINPLVLNIPYDITMSTPGMYDFVITGEGICGPVEILGVTDIEFCDAPIIYPIFHEGNIKSAMTGPEIEAELRRTETARYPGTYAAYGTGYKYIAIPDSLMEGGRPTEVYQPLKLRSDIGHIDFMWNEVDSGANFNPMYAMNPPYNVTILGVGYKVFRSTYEMVERKDITLFDHLLP